MQRFLCWLGIHPAGEVLGIVREGTQQFGKICAKCGRRKMNR